MNYHDEARRYLPSSNCLKRKYACVIVNSSGIMLSVGFNYSHKACTECARQNTDHNVGDYAECSAIHAEQMAMLNIGIGQHLEQGRLRGTKLYLVCDQDPDPTPCPFCQKLMDWCGVELRREIR